MSLGPWPTEVAAELKGPFGADTNLGVGWIWYPNCTLNGGCREESTADLDPLEIEVAVFAKAYNQP